MNCIELHWTECSPILLPVDEPIQSGQGCDACRRPCQIRHNKADKMRMPISVVFSFHLFTSNCGISIQWATRTNRSTAKANSSSSQLTMLRGGFKQKDDLCFLKNTHAHFYTKKKWRGRDEKFSRLSLFSFFPWNPPPPLLCWVCSAFLFLFFCRNVEYWIGRKNVK